MARYPLGKPVRIPVLVRDPSGALADATTVTITVKTWNADGTQTTTGTYASPAHDSTGTYHQDVPVTDLATAGHYQWKAVATGTVTDASFGEFDVFDPFEPSLLPLQDAKDALNWNTTTANDAEIAQYVATIETSLEAMTGGPLVNTTVTERAEFSCDMQFIQVRQRPLVSVTSIVSIPNGATVDITAGLDLDPVTGVIRTKGGWSFSAFSRLATVTYVAGWGTQMPAAFNTAARMILQSLWSTQHGPSARPQMAGGELVNVPGFGFAVPPQAAEILEGSLNGLPFISGGVFA